MAKASKPDVDGNPESQVKAAAKAEKRLLKEESEAAELVAVAERRLLKAEGKLNRARARFDKRQAELLAAEEVLRQCQSARALGPVENEETPVNSYAESAPESDASPLPEPSADSEITE